MWKVSVLLVVAVAVFANAELPNNSQDPVQVVLLGQKTAGKAKPLCKECEKVVTSVKKILDNPELEQQLLQTLTDVCNMPIFSPVKQICLDVVNDLVVILHQVQSILDDPEAVCKTLHLCSQETPGLNLAAKKFILSVTSKYVQDLHKPSVANGIDVCNLCVEALNEVTKFLQTPEYLIKIENEILKVCKYAGKFEKDCNELVDYAFPKLIQKILDFLCQPIDVCTSMKLCKSSQNIPAPITLDRIQIGPHLNRLLTSISSLQVNGGLNVKCITCKAAVGKVLDILKQDKVVTTISTDVTNFVCKLFPKELQDGCFDFMAIYFKSAVIVTLDEWSPEEICTDLHACKNTTSPQIQLMMSGENSQLVCNACKFLSNTLAKELEKPEVQQDIVNVLTQGCLLLPGKLADKCGDTVIEYVPFGLGYVVDFLNRQDACNVLHLC